MVQVLMLQRPSAFLGALVKHHRTAVLTASGDGSALSGQAQLTLPLESLIDHGRQRMQPRAPILVGEGGATVHLVCSSSGSMPVKIW